MVSQPHPLQRLPELADHHFRHWKSAFEDLTGIQLGSEREGLVRSVLQARLLEKGVSCFENYLHQLLSSPGFGRIEWDVLFTRILIGETRFFRHMPTFDFIGRYLKEQLRHRHAPDRHLRGWSVGCSSGEETYSLAMVMYRACKGGAAEATFSAVGTDINADSLERGRWALYKNILRRGVEKGDARVFFEPAGDGLHAVRSFIRERVTFAYHNMLEPVASPLLQDQDIICCQNVLIYLQGWRRRAVVRQLVSSLKVGGALVVGPGELLGWKPDGLERIQAAGVQAYRKL
jgi:type IV pilus assembly protein PilK